MSYLGTIGERITAQVTLKGIYEYDAHFAYTTTTHYIYNMQDADGNVIVWKSTTIMGFETNDKNGDWWYSIKKGDVIEITGRVKEHSEYKGTKQTVIQRAKVKLIEKAVTKEEIIESKRREQLASIKDGDEILYMPYRQYKEHYADCETLADSYNVAENNTIYGVATIGVIVRDGRLKASGVRGKHYSGYRLENDKGEQVTYRAVSEENALKRANKEFPNETWNCIKVFRYERRF